MSALREVKNNDSLHLFLFVLRMIILSHSRDNDKRKHCTSEFVLNIPLLRRCYRHRHAWSIDINITDYVQRLPRRYFLSTLDFSTDRIDAKPILQDIHYHDESGYDTHRDNSGNSGRFGNDLKRDDSAVGVLAMTTPIAIAKAFAGITAIQRSTNTIVLTRHIPTKVHSFLTSISIPLRLTQTIVGYLREWNAGS